MASSDAVTQGLLRGTTQGGTPPAARTLAEASPVPVASGVRTTRPGAAWRIDLEHGAWTDRQVLLAVSAALFVVGAWPLALTEVPPYQDLPNHLATLTVIQNADAYPDYVFNGFFKTNAALFTWLFVVGKVVGVKLAARLFAVVTLAANAFVLPRFVLRLGGSRGRMLVASLLAWPMVHNWFVSMGMLDFAFALPLSLALLLAIDRQRTAPSTANAVGIAALGFVTWYAHVFPLLVVHLLVGIEAVRLGTARARPRSERLAAVRAMLAPLAPLTLLAVVSVAQHARDAVGPIAGFLEAQKVLAPWELVYNLWAEWFWGYTNLSLSSMVPCVVLAVLGVGALRRTASPPVFFSGWAFIALAVLFCFLPYKMTNWFHVNSRLIPYLWVGLLLYVPASLPKPLAALLGISGILYTAGMGIDFVRLDREREEFSAGIAAVPEGAKLLPLVFQHKSASVNTRNLLHMWGYYVVERRTSAPLLFAHSHSFPVTYREPPPTRFNHLVLESFAPEATTPAAVCRAAARFDDCDALFTATWQKFYGEALPRYDHLLLWDPTPEAAAMVPREYTRTFERGRLSIYARSDVAARR